MPIPETLLAWREDLSTGQATMDRTHREFLDHLAALEPLCAETEPQRMLPAYDTMLAHTVEHFAQEDRWMAATGFAPENCHSLQHRQVLELLREVRRRIAELGEVALLGQLLPELAMWFDQHARAADAGLAAYMAELGWDGAPETAPTLAPSAEPALASCGSSSCSGD